MMATAPLAARREPSTTNQRKAPSSPCRVIKNPKFKLKRKDFLRNLLDGSEQTVVQKKPTMVARRGVRVRTSSCRSSGSRSTWLTCGGSLICAIEMGVGPF